MVLTKKETEASIFLTNLMKLQNFYWRLNALASFNELDILSDVTITREDILSNKHVTSEEEMLWSNLKLDLSEEEKQQLRQEMTAVIRYDEKGNELFEKACEFKVYRDYHALFDEFLNQINGKADSLDYASEIVLSNLSDDLRQYISEEDVRFCLSADRLVCDIKDEENVTRTMDLVEQNMVRLDSMHKNSDEQLMENIGDELVMDRKDIVEYFYESYEDYISSSFAVSLAQRKKHELNLLDVLQEETYHQYNEFLDDEQKNVDHYVDNMYVYAFELLHDKKEVNDLFESLLAATENHTDLYLATEEFNESSNDAIQQILEPVSVDIPFDFNKALKKAEERYYDGEIQGEVPYYADYLVAKDVRLSSAKQEDYDLDM